MRIYDIRNQEEIADTWCTDIKVEKNEIVCWLASGYIITFQSDEVKIIKNLLKGEEND